MLLRSLLGILSLNISNLSFVIRVKLLHPGLTILVRLWFIVIYLVCFFSFSVNCIFRFPSILKCNFVRSRNNLTETLRLIVTIITETNAVAPDTWKWRAFRTRKSRKAKIYIFVYLSSLRAQRLITVNIPPPPSPQMKKRAKNILGVGKIILETPDWWIWHLFTFTLHSRTS